MRPLLFAFLPHTAALEYVFACCFFLLFFSVDVMHCFLFDFHLHFPSDLLLAIALGLLGMGGVCILMMTTKGKGKEKRKMWRPCEGPGTFVLLQGMGWAFFAIALLGGLVCMWEIQRKWVMGIATLIGCVGCCGLVLLKLSLFYFDEERMGGRQEEREREVKSELEFGKDKIVPANNEKGKSSNGKMKQRVWGTKWIDNLPFNADSSVAAAVSFVSVILFVTADLLRLDHFYPSYLEFSPASSWSVTQILVGAGQIGFFVSSFALHAMGGASAHLNYSLIMPFRNTPSFIATQAIAWTCLSVQFVLVLIFFSIGLPKFAIPLPLTQLGIVGLLSQMFLFLSIRCFDDRDMPSDTLGWSAIVKSQATFALLLSGSASFSFIGIDYVRFMYPGVAYEQIGMTIGVVAAIASLFPPFVIHETGKKLHLHYKSWMPFEGGTQFILLQTLGWTGYTLAGLMTWIYLTNYAGNIHLIGISLVSLGSFVSNLLILASLSVFKANAIVDTSENETAPRRVSFFRVVLSGEMVVAWIISCVSLLLFVLVDTDVSLFQTFRDFFVNWEGLNNYLPYLDELIKIFPRIRSQLFVAGILCQIFAAWVIHVVSGPGIFSQNYILYQPFVGGAVHVTLQAFGWTLSGITLIFHFLVYSNSLEFLAVRGISSLAGLITFLGLLLLWLSVPFFRPSNGVEVKVNLSLSNISGTNQDVDALQSCLEGLNELAQIAKHNHLALSVTDIVQQSAAQISAKLIELTGTHIFGMKGSKTIPASLRWKSEVFIPLLLAAFNVIIWFLADVARFMHLQRSEFGWDEGSHFASGAHISLFQNFLQIEGLLRISRGLVKFSFANAWLVLFLVHGVAGPRLYRKYRLYQPFVGGWKFCLMQAIGIVLSAFAILLTSILIYYGIENVFVDGLMTSIGLIQVVGSVCFIYSLQLFQDASPLISPKGLKQGTSDQDTDSNSEQPIVKRISSVFYSSDYNTAQGDMVVSIILSLNSVALFVFVDYLQREYPGIPSTPLVVCASLAMLFGVSLAYWATNKPSIANDESNAIDETDISEDSGQFSWLQMLGLTLSLFTFIAIAIAIRSQIYRIQPIASFITATGFAGVTGVVAEITLVVIAFSGGCVIKESKRRRYPLFSWNFVYEALIDIRALFVVTFFYALHLIMYGSLIGLVLIYQTPGAFAMLFYVTFRILLPRLLVLILNSLYSVLLAHAFWTADYNMIFWLVLTLGYGLTYISNANKNGSRRWKWFRELFFWQDFARYFDFKILSDASLSPEKTYVFGYHPHGILPFGIIWSFLTREFKERFPDVELDSCGATILTTIPILRDLGMWAGGRDVSSESISQALMHKRSIALVPGGQAEMRESRQVKKMGNKIYIFVHHQGFIRMALKYGVDLVPVFAFGETEIFENIYLPNLQQWFLSRVGFLFPIWVYGRFYLNIPHNHPLRMAIGEPIAVQQIAEPTKEDVDVVHKRYYDSLLACFEKHKHAAGYGDCELLFSVHPKK